MNSIDALESLPVAVADGQPQLLGNLGRVSREVAGCHQPYERPAFSGYICVGSGPQRKALVHAYTMALDPNPLAGIESALRRCTVPTRIVWGTSDTIFSAESPGYLDRILPNSRGVRRIAGAMLFFPEEFPKSSRMKRDGCGPPPERWHSLVIERTRHSRARTAMLGLAVSPTHGPACPTSCDYLQLQVCRRVP